jgi:hypothetical protein
MHLLATILRLAVEKRLLFFGMSGLILIIASIVPVNNILQIFRDQIFQYSLCLDCLGIGFHWFVIDSNIICIIRFKED